MRIALATVWLFGRTGTEVVTIDLAKALKRRGHEVFVFAGEIGESTRHLLDAWVDVVDDINRAPFEPEVVHGNHNVALVQALMRFPGAAGVYVCHDATLWQNRPPDLSRIRRYLAVDRHCLERCERDLPRLSGRVAIVHNAVDLETFRPRPSLPDRPGRALILTKHTQHIEALRAVCGRRGLDADVLGAGAGQIVDDVAARLQGYDVVFATARMAIEAMAVGCAVIVCDARGFAGLVTPGNVASWRDRNFGAAILKQEVSERNIEDALDAYDAGQSAEVARFIRDNNSLAAAARIYEEVYAGAIQDNRSVVANEPFEVSAALRDWLPDVWGHAPVRKQEIELEVESLRMRCDDLERRLGQSEAERVAIEALEAQSRKASDDLNERLDRVGAECAGLRLHLDSMQRSRAIKVALFVSRCLRPFRRKIH